MAKYKRRNRSALKANFRKGKFSVSNKALRMAAKALSLINVEHKYIDTTDPARNVSAGGHIQIINPCAQGSSQTSRNGQSVKNTSLYVRMHATHNALGTPGQMLRYLILKDKQPNGASAAGPDVLDTVNMWDMRNIEQAKRFKVYRDKTFVLSSHNPDLLLEEFIDLTGEDNHTEYKSNTGTITDISTNSYLLIIFSTAASNYPVVSTKTRIRFLDN